MRLRLTLPTVIHGKGLRLMPGINVVDDAAGEAFLRHPLIAARVAMGQIQVVRHLPPAPIDETDDNDPGAGGGEGAGDERPAGEIVAEIAETYDMARLREYLSHPRKTVAAAAEKQIAKIDKEAAPDADS
ncbi:hypothetical protein ACFOGJ_08860 [Marinibaculum pumilum]|uniref:Uncharacterized protein n=1 Tax=Marinibaculum pumilum TaxID=1766165 RepID=A0ABV7KYF8_9PROT